MDEEYDVIVCGTGLEECILSGLLSVSGKKVLHLDRNPYYGGDSASLNLTNLFSHFNQGDPPSKYGANRYWNVDLIPKFVMARGKLVKILLHTKVTQYLNWQVVEGTYVYQQMKQGFFSSKVPIHKVPSTATEVMTSSLMGLMEKRRCKNFFQYAAKWSAKKEDSWKGFNPEQTSMHTVFDYFNLQQNTVDFIGHAVALYTNDNYLNEPMKKTMEKIALYMHSISNVGKSPFIYPLYGLGGLPEGFSRLSAIHGSTYMLNTPIKGFVYDTEGKVCGVEAESGEVARCKQVLCDPSYIFNNSQQNKIFLAGRVIRCVCILARPIPNTNNSHSCQIIFPQKQLDRKNDVYITMVSSSHGVALPGKYIAIVSTFVETANPEDEITPALEILGEIEYKFLSVSDLWKPTKEEPTDNVYVSASFDATSHFESASEDVLRLWKQMTGTELDLSANDNPDTFDDVEDDQEATQS